MAQSLFVNHPSSVGGCIAGWSMMTAEREIRKLTSGGVFERSVCLGKRAIGYLFLRTTITD